MARDSAGRFRARRVVVKARVVKLNPQRKALGPKMPSHTSKAVHAHLRYLERDGVTRDGEKGRAYSVSENHTDGRAFLARGREDRHQFRFIVAPEDAADLGDLRGLRWPRNFEQGVKWNLGLTAGMLCLRIRSEDEETSPPEPHTGLQGESGLGCAEERSNDYAAC